MKKLILIVLLAMSLVACKKEESATCDYPKSLVDGKTKSLANNYTNTPSKDYNRKLTYTNYMEPTQVWDMNKGIWVSTHYRLTYTYSYALCTYANPNNTNYTFTRSEYYESTSDDKCSKWNKIDDGFSNNDVF